MALMKKNGRLVRMTASHKAEQISDQIPDALVPMGPRLLIGDVMRKYRCKYQTAAHAVALSAARVARSHGH